MSELGVSKFMQTARRPHAEITPDVFTAAEVQLLHGARAGLEPLLSEESESEVQITGTSQNRVRRASRKVSSTSSGFSLVIRAAMTCPLGLGMHSGVSKLMTVSPHGGSP